MPYLKFTDVLILTIFLWYSLNYYYTYISSFIWLHSLSHYIYFSRWKQNFRWHERKRYIYIYTWIRSDTYHCRIVVVSTWCDYFSPSKPWVLWNIRRRYRSQCANRRRREKRRKRRGEKKKKGKERRETSEPLARSSWRPEFFN